MRAQEDAERHAREVYENSHKSCPTCSGTGKVEIDFNAEICPICEKNTISDGDYLCEDCR